MSASMPSLLSEAAPVSRRQAALRASKDDASAAEAFSVHLRDDAARPSAARTARPANKPEQPPQQPERPAKAERPEHPADPRRARAESQEPRASERGRARASDRAVFTRSDCDEPHAETPDDASAPAEPAEPAAIAGKAAGDVAADAALTIETALATETTPAPEMAAAAEKNDSALAAAAGLLPIPVTPTLDASTQQQPDAAETETLQSIAPPAAPAAKGAEPVPATPAAHAASTPDADAPPAADDSQPQDKPANAPAQPAPQHGTHLHNANAADPSPRAQPHQEIVGTADGLTGPKPHNPHGHGLQIQLQPAADFSPAAPAQPAQPMKAADAMPVQAVPIAIGLKALEGAREFEIRLDPAELGRVDVKLSISEDGRVQASLVVDRVETLALLQRDARTLERAFDQAGLTADANAIQFSLRQDGDGQKNSREAFDDSGAASHQTIAADPLQAQDRPAQLYRGFVRETAVDIRV